MDASATYATAPPREADMKKPERPDHPIDSHIQIVPVASEGRYEGWLLAWDRTILQNNDGFGFIIVINKINGMDRRTSVTHNCSG